MNFTLNKAVYDGLSGWKWTALKHVMGDLLLGDPAGLDPEAPILDADGEAVVVFSDERFTAEKALALRLVIAGLDALPDEPGEEDTPESILAPVSDKAGFALDWQPGVAYAVGQVVFYAGNLYRCVQGHTSQADWQPDSTPALWTGAAAPGEIPEWVQPQGAHDAYQTGDRVTHNGQTWESTIDANVWEPGVYGWVVVED